MRSAELPPPPPPAAAASSTNYLPLILTGVVVGAALALMGCCVLVFVLWRRRRARRQEEQEAKARAAAKDGGKVRCSAWGTVFLARRCQVKVVHTTSLCNWQSERLPRMVTGSGPRRAHVIPLYSFKALCLAGLICHSSVSRACGAWVPPALHYSVAIKK